MRLKTFTARTMQEAMAEVRSTLGLDAIIVSSRGGENGSAVRVTAAIEDIDPPHAARYRPPVQAEPTPPVETVEEILAVEEIWARHGVENSIAERLTRSAAAVETEEPALTVAAAIDSLFRFSVIEDHPSRPLLVLGLPGAGKTATIAKLAAQSVLAGKSATLLTMDSQGAGAMEQITAYARLLNLNVTAVPDADALASAVTQARAEGSGLILIDQPGLNPYDTAEVEAVKALLDAVDAEPVAVVAAGGDAGEAADLSLLLHDLGCRRFIATKLDLARRFGSLLSFAHAGPIAIAGVSASPYIGDPVDPINPVSLARILAVEPKAMVDVTRPVDGASPDQRRTVVTS